MDEIEQRLRESADTCFKSYEAWRKSENDSTAREALQDAVHELRKVASRVEIELAISERNEMAQKPIPIPPHRDARGRHQSAPDGDDDFGNSQFGPGEQRGPRGPSAGGQRRNQAVRAGMNPRRDGGSRGGPREGGESFGNGNE
jgi:hypothetical protein